MMMMTIMLILNRLRASVVACSLCHFKKKKTHFTTRLKQHFKILKMTSRESSGSSSSAMPNDNSSRDLRDTHSGRGRMSSSESDVELAEAAARKPILQVGSFFLVVVVVFAVVVGRRLRF